MHSCGKKRHEKNHARTLFGWMMKQIDKCFMVIKSKTKRGKNMKEVLYKTELVRKVAGKTGIPKYLIKIVLNAFIEVTKEEVSKDVEIRLVGFGTFKKVQRAARKGRNPVTGEEIEIASSESLSFKSRVKY